VAFEFELETGHGRVENAKRFFEELLPCLVSFQEDDRFAGHVRGD
jgi:hypothetical protein